MNNECETSQWCGSCGGYIHLDTDPPAHVCVPETADGFSLGGEFYRFDRQAHLWLQRKKEDGIWRWIPASLPGDVLLEVAHMRDQLIR